MLFLLNGCGLGVAWSLNLYVSLFDLLKSAKASRRLGVCILLLGTNVRPLDRTLVSVSVSFLEERLVTYFCEAITSSALFLSDLLYLLLWFSGT